MSRLKLKYFNDNEIRSNNSYITFNAMIVLSSYTIVLCKQGRIYTRATWAAVQGGGSKRAAKMRISVYFSRKFLNIYFQYLKTKKSRSLIL